MPTHTLTLKLECTRICVTYAHTVHAHVHAQETDEDEQDEGPMTLERFERTCARLRGKLGELRYILLFLPLSHFAQK